MLSVLFVDGDAGSGGDGASWATAFDDLQAALDSAGVFNADGDSGNDVDQIWVAEGTYRPWDELESGDPRSATFRLVDGVALYGGFAGTEALLSEREWTAHETVLSGDLGSEDDISDNAYTVVFCDTAIEATLDGVSIVKGNADGSGDDDLYWYRRRGGGISCEGTLALTNSTLQGNKADWSGGGIYSKDGTLTLTNVTLSGNRASRGGGIYAVGTLQLTNSTLSGNTADEQGGGIYCQPVSMNVVSVTIHNTVLWQNEGGEVEGDGNWSGSRNLIGIDPEFVRNPSDGGDGWGDDPDTTEDESANDDYGDLRLTSASPAINYGKDDLLPDGLEQDIDGNSRMYDAAVDCGAFEFQGQTTAGRETPSVTANTSEDRFDLYDGQISLREAIWYAGSGTLGTTVTFDAGLDGSTITLLGRSLWLDKAIEIDASSLNSLTIDADGQSRAFTVIAPDEENVELDNLAITGGFAEYGGGIHNSSTLTVVDSALSGNAASKDGGGIYSSRGALTVTNSTLTTNSADWCGGGICAWGPLVVSDSSFLQNGARDITFRGGGICSSAEVLVADSVFEGNEAQEGGGILAWSGGNVRNSTFSSNSAEKGGAIVNTGAMRMTHSTLFANTADDGGAIANHGGMTMTNSILFGNKAEDSGGAIRNYGATLTIVGCRLFGNATSGYEGRGGGIHSERGGIDGETDAMLTLTNSTISSNHVVDFYGYGGGVSVSGDTSTTYIHNSVIAGNSVAGSRSDVYVDGGTLSGIHSLLGVGSGQTGIVNGENGNLVGTDAAPIDPRFTRDPLGRR